MTGSLLRIQRISKDIKGIMLEVDLNYIIPIVNKIVNSENLLYLRENPCFSITEYQYNYLEQLIKALQQRMDIKAHDIPLQRQHLISELIKSWGQTLCYELLNVYFTNQPLKPLSQDKKDKIFQNFVITLFRYYQQERDVTFYASKQYLSSRYFSAVIKENPVVPPCNGLYNGNYRSQTTARKLRSHHQGNCNKAEFPDSVFLR